MDASQFKIFRDITLDYFSKLSPQDLPSISEAYMQFDKPVFLDYASMVNINGEYVGCLYVTTSRKLIERLLALHGEPANTDETRLDMCRELSNVLSGNASHAFGSTWHISVPRTLQSDDLQTLHLPPSSFVIPINWLDELSYLVVGLEHHSQKQMG
jgi:CheY-specific phosphatase CheX